VKALSNAPLDPAGLSSWQIDTVGLPTDPQVQGTTLFVLDLDSKLLLAAETR
jgi:hypothetical protein